MSVSFVQCLHLIIILSMEISMIIYLEWEILHMLFRYEKWRSNCFAKHLLCEKFFISSKSKQNAAPNISWQIGSLCSKNDGEFWPLNWSCDCFDKCVFCQTTKWAMIAFESEFFFSRIYFFPILILYTTIALGKWIWSDKVGDISEAVHQRYSNWNKKLFVSHINWPISYE